MTPSSSDIPPDQGGAPELPPRRADWVPFFSPKPGRPLRAFITSIRPVTLWTHWTGADRCRCAGSAETCMWCAASAARRWSGYLACVDRQARRQWLAELTYGAVRTSPSRELRDPALSLRGLLLTLTRLGASPNSPVGASVEPSLRPLTSLPDAVDVRGLLLARFRLADPPRPAEDAPPTFGVVG